MLEPKTHSKRYFVKRCLSAFFSIVGGSKIVYRSRKRSNGAILMYHRVLRTPGSEIGYVQPGMYVKEESFRRQLEFLNHIFKIIPLSELVHRIMSGQSVAGCCAITFDDGWRDNYLYAFPALKRTGLPATIFLATNFIGTGREFWPEELTGMLKQEEGFAFAAKHVTPLKPFVEKYLVDRRESDFFEGAISAFKALAASERSRCLSAMKDATCYEPSIRLLMNWQEAMEMQSSGLIEFGGHSAEHVILDQVGPEEAHKEIHQSFHAIKQHLGAPPEVFAYPNGNFNARIASIVAASPFKGAVTTQKHWCRPGMSPFRLPRIGIHEDVAERSHLLFNRILFDRF